MQFSLNALLITCILRVGPALADISNENWTYAGAGNTDQGYWKDIPGAFCDGSLQSPINIVTKWTQDIQLPPFDLDSYDNTMDAVLENNGHALEVEFHGSAEDDSDDDDENYYDITGGGLSGIFRAYQFHFHFGSDREKGSEHTIDGERYPSEMHIVHYDTAYGSPREAIQHKGGIAVLGFFLEQADEDNSALEVILSEVSHVLQPDSHFVFDEGIRLSHLLPSSLDKFWRYDGSLTTPMCNEVVTWTLFEDTIKISKDQLDVMRTLMSDAENEAGDDMPMYNNYRDTQSRGTRTVYSVIANDDDDLGRPSPTGSAGRSTLGVLMLLVAFLSAFTLRF